MVVSRKSCAQILKGAVSTFIFVCIKELGNHELLVRDCAWVVSLDGLVVIL